jgi:hypothetical protein
LFNFSGLLPTCVSGLRLMEPFDIAIWPPPLNVVLTPAASDGPEQQLPLQREGAIGCLEGARSN